MLSSVVAQAAFIALIGVDLLAFASRDRWVRLSALLHTANWVLVALVQDHGRPVFQTSDFLVDVIGAVLATVIAVRSNASWAASVGACQWLGVVSRLAPLLDPTIHRRATITALYVWEAGALAAITVGAVMSFLALGRIGSGGRPGGALSGSAPLQDRA